MIRCGIVEENEAMLARFMGGLNKEIQTILEYKEYNNITFLATFGDVYGISWGLNCFLVLLVNPKLMNKQ